MQSRNNHRGIAVCSLLAHLMCISAALDGHSKASIQTNAELHAALVDMNINTIILEHDLQLDTSIWTSLFSSANPYIITRNLTLVSSPPYRILDLAWIGDGQVRLAPGSWLNISQLILHHSRLVCACVGFQSHLDWWFSL